MKQIKTILAMLCCLLLSACSSLLHGVIREDCDKQIKEFNKMLRWHEIEKAGIQFITPESRAAFLKGAESFRKRGVTITDYRIIVSECLPENKSANSTTLFEYYTLPSNRIKSVTYNQEWIYSENSSNKGWKLKSNLPEFE